MLFKTSIFFLQNQRIELIVWPGNSPDLNPIENIWAIIKMKLREYKVDKRDLTSTVYMAYTGVYMFYTWLIFDHLRAYNDP